MQKLTIRVRTSDNLLDLLKVQQSGCWVIGQGKEQEITHVEVVSFDGSQRIEAVFDLKSSKRLEDGRFILGFLDACIRNCSVSFDGQNPVRYI